MFSRHTKKAVHSWGLCKLQSFPFRLFWTFHFLSIWELCRNYTLQIYLQSLQTLLCFRGFVYICLVACRVCVWAGLWVCLRRWRWMWTRAAACLTPAAPTPVLLTATAVTTGTATPAPASPVSLRTCTENWKWLIHSAVKQNFNHHPVNINLKNYVYFCNCSTKLWVFY